VSDNGVSVDSLLDAYRAELEKLSHRDRALREVQIYMALGGTGQRREVLRANLGGSVGEYELRQTLLGADEWAGPLWDLWDKGASTNSIGQLLVEARKRARLKNRRCADVLDELLEEHKRAAVKQAPKESSRPKPPPTPPPPPQEPRGGEDEHRLSKQFSEQLRLLTSQYVRDACVGLEDYDASKLIGDFTGFVREAADDLRRRLTAARKRIRAKQDQPLVHVTRASFDHACELLVVRGTYGKPIDLRDAKRRQLRRAADAHPDRWGGTPHSVEEFQAIIGAYSVLEQYMEELTARSTTRSP